MSRRGVKSQRVFKQGKRSGGSEEAKKIPWTPFLAIPGRAAADSFVPRSGYYSVLAGYWAAGSQEQARGQRQLSASSGNYRRDVQRTAVIVSNWISGGQPSRCRSRCRKRAEARSTRKKLGTGGVRSKREVRYARDAASEAAAKQKQS